MASTIFRVSRTEQEGQPSGAATLNRAQDPLKIKIYDTTEDIDTSDLAENEVVATIEEEPLANIHITDSVQDGNMNPVTSNAVADAIAEVEDSASSNALPLGGWTSFENDTAPNSQWIKAGTTFDENEYPELYMYLGSNVVPERYDHSRLSEAYTLDGSDILHPLLSTTNFVCPYDGVITANFWESGRTGQNALVINNTRYCGAFDIEGADVYDSVTVSVKAGDLVKTYRGHSYISGDWAAFARWYTHPMFIKATSVAGTYLPSDAVIEIKNYTKSYVDAKNSYSTEETLTGGTWIDGKPIYRKVIQSATFTTSNPLCVSIPNLDTFVDIKFKRNYDSSHPTWWVIGDGNASANNLFIKQSISTDTIIIEPVSNSITINNFTGIIEYTKTTD